MRLRKLTYGLALAVAMLSSSANAYTDAEQALLEQLDSITAETSQDSVDALVSRLVTANPALAADIVSLAVSKSPASTASIVSAAITSVKKSGSNINVDAAIANIAKSATKANPSAAAAITSAAVSETSDSATVLNIVSVVSEEVQVAVINLTVTAEVAETLSESVESTAISTAASNNVTVTTDQVRLASNEGALNAATNAGATAAGDETQVSPS